MIRIGVTGHQKIPASAQHPIECRVRGVLEEQPEFHVVTSLAAGADQLVALAARTVGGAIEAIVPCRGYADVFESRRARDTYAELLAAAVDVCFLDFAEPSEEAFWAAGRAVVDRADLLLAIWDGEPSRGLGGTGDVVAYAQRCDLPVEIVWPEGVGR